ncbi:hypothetical protein JCM6882_001963 [Rhodosporidiobolus microsporus]
MRDPRLNSPSPTSPPPRPVHQDVLDPSSSSHRHSSRSSSAHQHSRSAEAYYARPGASSAPLVDQYGRPLPLQQPYPSSSSSRHDPRYAQPNAQQPQYFWDPQRQQHFLALPVPPPQVEEPVVHQQPAPAPPAPTPIHRVYVLRCSTCDTFLSDRGMRAVLLLKPHIVLFSTDAPPANTDTFWPDSTEEEEQVERTCDCLTSSINCHGCGRTVGYNIVSPCTRCNASVQKHQRSANHHRFVFHHNEVVASERRYYPGEKGVLNPIIPPPSSASSSRHPSPQPVPAESDKDASDVRRAQWRAAHSRRSPTPGAGPRPRTLLQPGATVYWHHLVSSRERAQPVDPKTREPLWVERAGR